MYSVKYHKKKITNLSFLITGGAGFIGANLVQYLIKYKAKKVVVLDNLETGSFENLKEFNSCSNFQFIKGDIKDIDDCEFAMKDIDYVFHQAALGSVPRSIKNPIATNETNINGFLNVLVTAKNSKTVKRLIYAASSSTYGDSQNLPKKEDVIGKPLSPYAVTKYVNELYADVFYKTYCLESIGLRYFNVFGPKQNPNGVYAAVIPKFICNLLNNLKITINGDGNHSRDFTYIENIIQANIKAAFVENKSAVNQVFNVGCGEENSLNKLVQLIQTNLKTYKVDLIDNIVFKEERKGDVKHSLADISKATDLLNYNPKYKFKEGLDITIKWFYNQTKNER